MVAESSRQSGDPEGQEIAAEIARQINELMAAANLSANDRSKLRALVGYMADEDPEEYNDFMLMYLSGDRDWREDHDAVFGSDLSDGD